MTKADIVEKLHATTGFSRKESTDLVESLLSILKNTLEDGEKIKIHGFGNFEVKQKKDRAGRNPATGAALTIEARRVLTFKPGILLRQAVNSQKSLLW
jgi:integration host factor subunit alpha